MDWWTKIRLELRHDETSRRDVIRLVTECVVYAK
jgi:hypothetical protein